VTFSTWEAEAYFNHIIPLSFIDEAWSIISLFVLPPVGHVGRPDKFSEYKPTNAAVMEYQWGS
jgi:hypothetical protein